MGPKVRAGQSAEGRGSCAGSASIIWDVLAKCNWEDWESPLGTNGFDASDSGLERAHCLAPGHWQEC